MLRITMSGFFAQDDIARFAAAVSGAHARLGTGPNAHVTLVDIREMDIQTQDAVSGFRQMLTRKDIAARRIAFVVGGTLARLQIKRAAEGRNTAYFTAVEQAEAWLFPDAR